MKILSIIMLVLVLFSACSSEQFKNTKVNFDFGWKFIASDVDGAEKPEFSDADWRAVDLPHDWSIEGNFSKDNPSFSRGGWLPTGKVSYRKTFFVDADKKDKRTVIYFDGAYRNSRVYINGTLLGERPLGYIAFYYDLSEHLNYGANNVLTVKLDNSSQPGSRWYTGTGIYRHVHLITTDKIYIPVWGNYIVADNYTEKDADIFVETKVKNDFDKAKKIEVKHSVYSPNGTLAGEAAKEIDAAPNSESTVKLKVNIPNPFLWSQQEPNRYIVNTRLLVDGEEVYSEETKTGIRKLEFDPYFGFKLNGEITKLKGVCLHHAGGPLGAAIHRRTVERQLEKLREMGCNAVRTAHNPFSEEFMDVCDSMGFLVMNEMFDEWELFKSPATTQNGEKIRIPVDFYASQFKEWADVDLADFVKRDRNHPSVIMWSIGNEIDQMRHPEGEIIGKRLAAIVHELDYRPVTNGVHGYGWGVWPDSGAAATSDIYGYNYIKDDGLDKERDLNPGKMTVITEHESAQSFYPRSTYLYGEEKDEWWSKLGYEHNDAFEWVEKRDIRGESGMDAWKWVKERDYIMGMFIWTGWDYLGEVIPFGWPARSSSFAPIDLAGFPKDGYYFYQSQWTDKPMVHIFPHWNLKGMEGNEVEIYGFTNAEEVELFQDGISLGRKKNNTDGVEYQSWKTRYKPGSLRAVAYRDGKQVAEKWVKTAGEPAKIKIKSRRTAMKANAQDLIYVECTLFDEKNVEVPTGVNKLTFKVDGPAKIAGVGNGNNMGLEPFQSNQISAFNGKGLAIIQSTKEKGEITITVSSKGLQSASIRLKSE